MRRTALCGFVLALAAVRADARTWTVGGTGADFPLIAPAIAAASAGDVIRVRGGVYRENLVLDKSVVLMGEGRPRCLEPASDRWSPSRRQVAS